jgi:hypothetical protein
MFCKSLEIVNFTVFREKACFVLAVLVGFIVIIMNVGGYALYSYFCSQKMLEKLYPYQVHHKAKTMAVKFIDGSGRLMLIGIIQSTYNICSISMLALLIVSILLSINVYFFPDDRKVNKYLNKNMYVVILNIFCIFGLFTHLTDGHS